MLEKMNKIIVPAENIFVCLSGVSLLIMMFCIAADTFARYLFNNPISGVGEFSEEYLMVIIVFFSLSYALRQGAHIGINIFTRHLPGRALSVIERIQNIIGFLFWGIISIQACREAILCIRIGDISSCILAYPLAPAYFFVAIGSALISLRLVLASISKCDPAMDNDPDLADRES